MTVRHSRLQRNMTVKHSKRAPDVAREAFELLREPPPSVQRRAAS